MSLNLAVLPDVVPDVGAVIIKQVRAYVISSKKVEENSGGGADCHSQSEGHWILGTDQLPIVCASYINQYRYVLCANVYCCCVV